MSAQRPMRAGHPLRGVLIALALPAFAYGLLTGISRQTAPTPAPSPAPISCPAQVAGELGIHWDPDSGATEELEAFAFGVISCERDRGEWICWHEESAESPSGLERICGQPSHLNEALASEVKIWAVDIHPIFPSCMEDEQCWDCRMMGNLTCGMGGYVYPPTMIAASAPRPLALVG